MRFKTNVKLKCSVRIAMLMLMQWLWFSWTAAEALQASNDAALATVAFIAQRPSTQSPFVGRHPYHSARPQSIGRLDHRQTSQPSTNHSTDHQHQFHFVRPSNTFERTQLESIPLNSGTLWHLNSHRVNAPIYSQNRTINKRQARTPRHGRKVLEKDFEIIGTLTGVAGGKIALPCNITPTLPKDAVSLILWYKDESTTPIYSVDARKGISLDAARRVTDKILASRSYMNTASRPYAHLMLELLTPEDAGEYACRVDFRKERTRNSVIFLKIIIPPEKPQIVDSSGEPQASLIGPYTEGDRLALVCEVEGGKPTPSVTWWRESVLLDDSYEQVTTPSNAVIVRNQLVINSLQRHDLMAVFTCQASNNNISLPAASTVTVDLNFRPLNVKITGERKPLSADKVSTLTCVSSGSRPPASITWWMGATRMKHAEEQISVDGNTTTSHLSITATVDDIGKEITCRAENSHIAGSAIEDTLKLDINFVPQITLRLGSNLRHSHIQEGNDVYFECTIRASPWVTEIRWHFEGRELQTNTTAGVIVSNQSLVLQKVRRHQRGKYTCSATNAEGDGESNSIHLRVQYAPVCKPGQKILYGAARHETVSVLCEVEADPPDVNFHWSYNGTNEPQRIESASLDFQESGSLSSVGKYTPNTEFDYGTVFCWARNSVGTQSKPCSYSIVAAGSPDSVRNCSLLNVTEDSMRVECMEGYDGGLVQHFVLEIYDTTDRSSSLQANVTSNTASFNLNRLQPAHSYLLVIYAANVKGRSKGIALTAFTLAMPESMNRLAKGNVWQLNFNPVLVVLIAIVTGVVLVAFFIVIIVRWKSMKPPMHRYQREKAQSGGNDASNGLNGDTNGNICKDKTHSASVVFRKGMVEEICDVCTTCTPGGSDDTENCLTTKSFDLGPDISLTSSEPVTKNTELDDDHMSSEKLTSLTTPLNCTPGSNGLTNIYSSTPVSNGSSNKHVTWRPETPPSPPPTVYTQYSSISYVPVPTSSIEPMSYQFVSQTPMASSMTAQYSTLPVSYSLSTDLNAGLIGADQLTASSSVGGGGYVINQATPVQYCATSYMHHVEPQQAQPHPVTSMSPYGPYTAQPTFSTLQHPRRVRVLPPSNVSTPPPPLHVPLATTGVNGANVLPSSSDSSRAPMTNV